jgi:predicted HicB family RNase H-like nuclease
MRNVTRFDGSHKAVVSYNKEAGMFRIEFVGLNGSVYDAVSEGQATSFIKAVAVIAAEVGKRGL